MKSMLCIVTLLGVLMITGTAFAAAPEAQGPMTAAVQPAAAPDGQAAAQPSPLQPLPDALFLSVDCTFVKNGTFLCGNHTQAHDCDEYRCVDSQTGQVTRQFRNCTPCADF
jgi:hypothetical protein